MTAKMSGKVVRARILQQMRTPARITESLLAKTLASPANREMLAVIATRQPRSISELERLSGDVEGGVSRALSALVRSGLVKIINDGRASVPTLTAAGGGIAKQLDLKVGAADEVVSPLTRVGFLSTILPADPISDIESDEVEGDLIARFRVRSDSRPLVGKARTNLTAASLHLLDNWWRILCRRAEPFNLFTMDFELEPKLREAMIQSVARGGSLELTAGPRGSAELWLGHFSESRFSEAVLSGIVRPVVQWLHLGRRFDRPVEAMLRRLEDVVQHPNEKAFCRTAGALGLAPHHLDPSTAERVRLLMVNIAEDDARLDFAAAINSEILGRTWSWLEAEVKTKNASNCLSGLPELYGQVRATHLNEKIPYQIGYMHARAVRSICKIADDVALGGVPGLARRFGGERAFAPSQAGGGKIRGFQAHGNDVPVIVIHDEGPLSNSFLMGRAIGDYVVHGSREAPVADLYTDRQAIGRAFAAEFLAPAAAVEEMVDEEGKSFEEIAAHFGVISTVTENQYNNAKRLRA
jgi:hypothetical protein